MAGCDGVDQSLKPPRVGRFPKSDLRAVPRLVVPGAPLRRRAEKVFNRSADEIAPAHPSRVDGGQQPGEGSANAAPGGSVELDCGKGFRFGLTRVEEEVSWPQRRGDAAENPSRVIYPDRLLPPRLLSIHDGFMGLPHVFLHEELGMGQPRDGVPLAIGN